MAESIADRVLGVEYNIKSIDGKLDIIFEKLGKNSDIFAKISEDVQQLRIDHMSHRLSPSCSLDVSEMIKQNTEQCISKLDDKIDKHVSDKLSQRELKVFAVIGTLTAVVSFIANFTFKVMHGN